VFQIHEAARMPYNKPTALFEAALPVRRTSFIQSNKFITLYDPL
jgi:hypothetical protein